MNEEAPTGHHELQIGKVIDDAHRNGYSVWIGGVKISHDPPVRVQREKSEVELLRDEIAQLKNQLAQPSNVPNAVPKNVRVQAVINADVVRQSNQEFPILFSYENDGSKYVRVYAGEALLGVMTEDEVEELAPGLYNRNIDRQTTRLGRGLLATREQYETQPRKLKPRRTYPIVQVPNLYVESDPSVNKGPAYELK